MELSWPLWLLRWCCIFTQSKCLDFTPYTLSNFPVIWRQRGPVSVSTYNVLPCVEGRISTPFLVSAASPYPTRAFYWLSYTGRFTCAQMLKVKHQESDNSFFESLKRCYNPEAFHQCERRKWVSVRVLLDSSRSYVRRFVNNPRMNFRFYRVLPRFHHNTCLISEMLLSTVYTSNQIIK